METVTYADGTTEQWQYDDFRQVSWHKDRSGVRLQTVRDPFDGTVMLQQYVDAAGCAVQVIGASDETAAGPKAEPVTPDDVAASFYQALGIDVSKEYQTSSGRPVMIVRNGTPLRRLWA